MLTDPSYAGQVVTFTYPHIGNYGTNPADEESGGVHCAGIVVRDLARRPSNWRSEEGLDAYLRRHRVPGLAGIDTRRLTRHLRNHGALPGAFGTDEAAVRAAAATAQGTDGLDLVATVTCAEPYLAPGSHPDAPFSVVAYDFGIKASILKKLVAAGCRVEVVPASTKADDVLARRPDGVFLSNGPGDPAGVAGAPDAIRGLLGEVPVFGICLGHQLLGLALGRHHVEAAVRPPRRQPPRPPDEQRRRGDHQPEPQLRRRRRLARGRRGHPREPQRRSRRGPARSSACGPSRCSTTPRPPPGPHDAAYLFDDFTALMEASR